MAEKKIKISHPSSCSHFNYSQSFSDFYLIKCKRCSISVEILRDFVMKKNLSLFTFFLSFILALFWSHKKFTNNIRSIFILYLVWNSHEFFHIKLNFSFFELITREEKSFFLCLFIFFAYNFVSLSRISITRNSKRSKSN